MKLNYNEICNFYCDESCYSQNDGNNFIVLAGIYCRSSNLKKVVKEIKKIKEKYNLSYSDELKWGKITESNFNLYSEIIQFIRSCNQVRVRAVIGYNKKYVKNKYEDWYQSMYYYLFHTIINLYSYEFKKYKLFIDNKDTHSKVNYSKTALYLQRKFNSTYIIESTPVNSKENQLIQIADIFAGAISYKNRFLTSNKAKNNIVDLICNLFDTDLYNSSSLYGEFKFNIFRWTGDF